MIKLRNAGTLVAGAMIAMGLGAVAASAEVGYQISVTLPQAITVEGKTLPSGAYKVSEVPIGEAASAFVFRNNDGQTAAVVEATKTLSPPDANSSRVSQKTEMILTPREDGTLHLNSMFVEGDTTGYRFMNAR